MQIDWWTLGLQAINFLVLVWLLWRFLFRPVKTIIQRRQELATQATDKAEVTQRQAEAEKARYESDRLALAEERRDVLKKAHDGAAAERQTILEAARTEARQITDAARKAMEEDRRQDMAALKDDIASLAGDMAAHILQSAAPDAYTGLLLDRLVATIHDLPTDGKTQFMADAGTGPATIVTARPLDDASKAACTGKLHQLLPKECDIRFEADAALGGGVELRLAHTIISYSFADQVKQAEAAIRTGEHAHG